jgi:hypothetical protein
MRFKFWTAAVAAALTISLIGATSASAATRAGNDCVGDNSAEAFTLYGAANGPGNSLPATIPVSGVVTSWTFNIIPVPSGLVSQKVKILRPLGSAQYRVIGESSSASISSGLNTFQTRIPVLAGDHIGVYGSIEGEGGAVYCETENPGDRLGVIPGDPGLGATGTSLTEENGLQVPITVSIEPDADNDGFGDETQDLCPQSALHQAACPPVTLSNFSQVKKGSVIIVVTPSTTAPVSVFGVVGLGKGKKAILNGGTQILAPGLQGKFVLKFTKGLNKKLAKLSRKRSLKLNVTVAGTSVTGAVTTSILKLKLKGRAKP